MARKLTSGLEREHREVLLPLGTVARNTGWLDRGLWPSATIHIATDGAATGTATVYEANEEGVVLADVGVVKGSAINLATGVPALVALTPGAALVYVDLATTAGNASVAFAGQMQS